MPLDIGQNIGQYRIVGQLGQGGMATVYKAYHPSLDRHVAIKILHSAFKDDETFYSRFQREAQIVAKLEHPHIVPVYDFDANESEPYLVMKFIEGETLKRRMKRQSLTLEQTLNILPSIADALTYAHDRGILHRDIKPSNVMLDTNEVPYLADFGLARIASSGESTMSQDVLIGTPNYISPEQAKGISLGPATDIYSLGILLYEIVVGRVPYSADTPYAVVHDHIYKPLPIPTEVNPDVPPQVEQVLLKALAKDPDDRYASANGMLADFERAVRDANMSELSVTNLRVDRLSAPDPSPPPSIASPENTLVDVSGSTQGDGSTPTYSQDEITTSMRELAEAMKELKELQSQAESSTSRPAIEAVNNSTVSRPNVKLLLRRRRRRRRNFWILSGVAALVFICIASLAVTINALDNPIVQSNPALADGYEDEVSEIEAEATSMTGITEDTLSQVNMSRDEVEALLEENPNDPLLYLILALRQMDEGDSVGSLQSVSYAIVELNAPGELLAQAAAIAATQGYTDEATWLWLAAYVNNENNDPLVRNSAGQYMYQQMDDLPDNDLRLIRQDLDNSPFVNSPFAQVMYAQGLLNAYTNEVIDDTALEQARLLIDSAVEDGNFAEAEFIYGNYCFTIGDTECAEQAWRFAASFEDSPDWVQRRAEASLSSLDDE